MRQGVRQYALQLRGFQQSLPKTWVADPGCISTLPPNRQSYLFTSLGKDKR